ncbi:hypothetical protein CCACVL1_26388 [Corchorus capsularis]|uniref:Uncharacterized protein n=1 Tax=Corchorus capsularis TaxID=210143 RepID=A0A1R3GF49_COCAP|nr:hypothetical protein CCACVL1_26388 [Corchorus capsularis]
MASVPFSLHPSLNPSKTLLAFQYRVINLIMPKLQTQLGGTKTIEERSIIFGYLSWVDDGGKYLGAKSNCGH